MNKRFSWFVVGGGQVWIRENENLLVLKRARDGHQQQEISHFPPFISNIYMF
jgi:hypothetical protein